jgi:expansin (peptidoglycan-binding protein)
MRGAAYKKGDIVWYQDKLYECLADHNPATDPTVSTFYWKPFQCPDGGIVDAGTPPPPVDPGPLYGGGAGCNDVDAPHQGSATFYTLLSASNVGHCSIDPLPSQPPYWLAMNFGRYGKSSDCGACLQATGPSGTATFIVVDECPNSGTDPLCMSMEHLDMAPQGFSAIGGNGRIDSLSWKYVPCDVQSNMVEVAAQSNSNNFFATVGVRKHRYRIAKVELVTGMNRLALMRRDDNYFIIDSTTPAGAAGMALGPYRLRITDIYGHWIENKVTMMAGKSTTMALQFPKCPAGGGPDGGL